uniref:HAT C-terminal dimerisation domain-containing protein n=1 Tax=Octopus bimaculoides TaxID=37653 RepID=A0A0L8FSM9_OCTBM
MVVQASYEIAMLITKSKKSHYIGESLIKLSLLRAAELVLGKDIANKLSHISLSNDTVKGRIDDLSQDIKDQILLFLPFSTHCILHREALASRTLPTEMRNVLNVAIKVVNFVKGEALNSRLFKLLCNDMESEHEALLFHTNLKKQIITHLTDLKTEFIRYVPDIDEKREAWKFIRNPFQCEVTNVLDEVQEEFLELKFNSPAKEDFKELDLETFWIKYLPVYLLISYQTLRVLAMFRSTYLCEAVFSTLVAVKTKYRNRLSVERYLRCALSGIQPLIQDLVAKKQCQVSR